VLSHVSKTHRH